MRTFWCILFIVCLAYASWGYEITFKEKPAKPVLNTAVPLVFNVGAMDLEEIAGQRMNLVMVDKDLEIMYHFAPVADAAGDFKQEIIFPEEDRYLLYFYFQPAGSVPVVKIVPLDVGKLVNKFGTVSMCLENEKRTADGSVICFITNPEELKEQTEIMFTFIFAELKSGRPIKTLLPYAGRGAQLIAINANQDTYLQKQSEEQGAAAYGPELHFKITFPKKGIYKLWLEYRTKKAMKTVPFLLQVK